MMRIGVIKSPSDFRWQYLPNFPKEVLNIVTEYFWSKYPTEEDIASIPYGKIDFGNIFAKTVPNLNNLFFQSSVLFLVSKPNSGLSSVHTDKSRDFSINLPIQVDPLLGSLLYGYHREYKSYKWTETVILNGLESNRFSYREKDFEKVSVDQPLILNTKFPHAWINNSDKHRVIGSFSLKVDNLDEAITIVKDWM